MPKKPPARPSDEELAQAYAELRSIRKVGVRYRRSHKTIADWLRDAGVETGPPGRPRGPTAETLAKKPTPEALAEMSRRLGSIRAASLELRVHPRTVGEWMQEACIIPPGRRSPVPVPGVKHGTVSGYTRHGCGCDDCKAAYAASRRRSRIAAKARQAAQ